MSASPAGSKDPWREQVLHKREESVHLPDKCAGRYRQYPAHHGLT